MNVKLQLVLEEDHESENEKVYVMLSQPIDCSYEEFRAVIEYCEKQFLEIGISKHGSFRRAVKMQFKAPIGTLYHRIKKFGLSEA